MELKTMCREDYDEAIAAMTAVQMIRDYVDECEAGNEKLDADWIRFILNGCPLADWQLAILREEESPEEYKKVTPRIAVRDVEEDDQEQ
jgi:hypothetical protein